MVGFRLLSRENFKKTNDFKDLCEFCSERKKKAALHMKVFLEFQTELGVESETTSSHVYWLLQLKFQKEFQNEFQDPTLKFANVYKRKSLEERKRKRWVTVVD